MFVGTVLTPKGTDYSELRKRGRTAEHSLQPIVFVARQAVFGDELGSDRRIAGARENS